MSILLNFTLQDACPSGLVIVARFQDVRGIDIVVASSSHHMVHGVGELIVELEFVHRNLRY